MKRINIFKPGKHTSSGGQTLDFSEDALKQAVEAYDPALSEAPIVIGHPKDNGPAFAWVDSLSYSEDRGIDAAPKQVNEDFAEMVAKGSFKKVSASWYTPDSPVNPKPGGYYLRHVGFLGAQPPAIKGLAEIEFSEEDGAIEIEIDFAEYETISFFKNFREWMIDKFSRDEADRVIPSYQIESLEDRSRAPKEEVIPEFSEPKHEGKTVNEEELKALQDQLDAQKADQDAKEASFSEREKKIAQSEAAARKSAIVSKVDSLVAAGKVIPANKDKLVAFCETLTAEQVVEFTEGDESKKESGLDFIFNFLESQGAAVDFNEHSKDDEENQPKKLTESEIANKALEYKESKKREGIEVSTQEALKAVESE